MDWSEAIVKAMKAYYAGMSPKELNGATGKRPKYNKSYFDKVGREYQIEPYELKKAKSAGADKDKKRG